MLLDVRDDHLKIVQDILKKFVPEREVWAFGSRAKWLAKEYSDLDLCIVGETPLSFRTLGLLEEAFEDSDLPYKVDVVDWATTSESFRKIIERDKVVVQKAAKGESMTWKTMSLEDWMAAIIDYRGKTPEKTSSGIPLITAKIVKAGRIENPEEFIAEGAYEQWMRRGIPEAGDVVLTTEAPLGEVAQLDGRKVALAQRIITLRGKPGLLDNTYLKFALQSQPIQEQLHGRASGSTVTGIKQSELRKLQLTFPPLDEQVRVAGILASLDNKIALNRRINQTLEAMAQAIFKSWFVDFDPVKAKITAKQEGSDPLRAAMSAISGKPDVELDALPPEQYAQLAATAAMFPDEMEESELGEIPKGWKVQRVGNVLELVYGKALKSTDRQEGTVPVYGSGGITGFHNTPLVTHGSIIVGRKGTVGSLYWEDDPFFPIDTTYYVRPLAAPLTFCYYTMQILGLEKMNTDAAVPGLNRENVYRLELVLPDSVTLQQFDIQATTLRKAIRANSGENKSLADLRDILLPKLLTGELSVTDTMIEAA